MQALQTQLIYELKRFGAQEKSIETLFIGGGTPSTVSPELYAPIFKLLKPYLAPNIEMTSEANPNSAGYAWLHGMYKLGINRISFGVQSFNEEKLKLLNRAHSPKQAKEAIINAAQIGFKNLSLDLIYATLGDTKELLLHDLETAFSLPINHLSAYALTIEEGTPFEKKPHFSKEKLSLTSWLFKEIKKRGFIQYEISNFGVYKSSHNLGYWLYKDYIGAGSGAVGKLGNKRFYPTSHLEAYIQNPLNIQDEYLAPEEKKLEQFFLGLRSCIGIKKEIMNQEELKRAQLLVDEKKLTCKQDTFYNPNYLLSDEIALFLSS
jgi:oxygen-independent coproporphyrinogen-3 oxidase